MRMRSDASGAAQVVPDGAQHPVLLVEEREDADVHRVERLDGVAQIVRPAGGDRGRGHAAAEALRRTGQLPKGCARWSAIQIVAPSTIR